MIKQDNSYVMGVSAEQEFIRLARRKNYEVKIATKNQNIKEHIDVYITNEKTYAIDVKSQKRTQRLGNIQEIWHPIEFIAVTYPLSNVSQINKKIFNPILPDFSIGSGRPGWLYGNATHIAFELQYVFLFVERINLIRLCSEKINFQKFAEKSHQAQYILFTRKDRGDLISFVHKNDLLSISTEKWYKPIVLDN
jgi:hypothetical protein